MITVKEFYDIYQKQAPASGCTVVRVDGTKVNLLPFQKTPFGDVFATEDGNKNWKMFTPLYNVQAILDPDETQIAGDI
jgi:hypothetical protein